MNCNLDYISLSFRQQLEPACQIPRKIDVPLSYREEDNAYVLPFINWVDSICCVLDFKGKQIPEPNCNGWPENPALYDLTDIRYVDEVVIYLGFMHTCFGHWFTDNLRKLWFLFSNEYASIKQSVNVRFAYTLDTNSPLTESQLFFFDVLGVDLRNAIVVSQPMQFRKLYIPDDSFCDYFGLGRQYTKEQEVLWNNIIRTIPSSPQKHYSKVYLTRTALDSAKDLGEEEIEAIFRHQGFDIVSPEKLALPDQLSLIRNTEVIATTEGSVSHLALFSNSGNKFVILVKTPYINTHQLCVNEFSNCDVTYIEAHHSSQVNKDRPWHGPFYLYPTRYLLRYLKAHFYILPYWLNKKYWIYTNNIIARTYYYLLEHIHFI